MTAIRALLTAQVECSSEQLYIATFKPIP